MRRALITGISGQDGYYLAHVLAQRGFEVWGVSRGESLPSDLLFVHPTPPADLRDQDTVDRVISAVDPSVIFHLAAQSSVSQSWNDPVGTAEVTGVGTARVLDAVHRLAPSARVFVASSSEIFGRPERSPQSEMTRILPISPYGTAKAYAHYIASCYRSHNGLFVATGILFNHESPRRPPAFVTQKIVRSAVAIARGEQAQLVLGDIEVRRDWGFAGDFANAMAIMTLDYHEPTDFVVATGQSHAVREWCEIAFAHVGLNWADFVVSDASLWRLDEPSEIVGDPAKAEELLAWERSLSFAELVKLMTDAELKRTSTGIASTPSRQAATIGARKTKAQWKSRYHAKNELIPSSTGVDGAKPVCRSRAVTSATVASTLPGCTGRRRKCALWPPARSINSVM